MSGQQGELSVAITGTDTLSPALLRVNERLERSKIALTASGAVAQAYSQKLAALHAQYANGEIDAIKYDRVLTRLDADFKRMSSSIQQYSSNTAAAAGATNQFVQHADHATRGATRLVFGIQSMSQALEGGRVSAQGLVGGLTALGVGSGPFLVIVAGLGLIGNALFQMGDKAEEAEKKIAGVLQRARGMGVQGTIQRIADLDAQANAAAPRTSVDRNGNRFNIANTGDPTAFADAVRERDALRSILPILQNDVLRERAASRGRGPHVKTPEEIAEERAKLALHGAENSPERTKKNKLEDVTQLNALSRTITGIMTMVHQSEDPLQNMISNVERLGDKFAKSTAPALAFNDALVAGLDAAASGGHVFQAFTSAVLGALSREAKGKAVFEAAEGFAALGKGLLFGDAKALASAAAHFKSAALYGGAAIATGALAGGGGGRGASGGSSTSSGPGSGTTTDRPHVTVIQVIGQRTSDVIAEYRYEDERLTGRGQSPRVIRMTGAQVTVGRGLRG